MGAGPFPNGRPISTAAPVTPIALPGIAPMPTASDTEARLARPPHGTGPPPEMIPSLVVISISVK
ncbi:hypothetical protein Nocox_30760 [Nonomuraea coxensis DSM 45129]|uniref:Uncharacterized protein n=1 Tax=Nonomuraea coxensis DSM 45129 TaxID=1122611 RepID=A0ABX8UA66_9ACTN|nr:hypothetical protein Nocox_30760 [Nonomuraea coxensis DSM 45129]